MTDYHAFVNRDLPPIERGCTSKAAFVTRRDAKSMIRRSAHGAHLKPYHCRYYDHWHLTSGGKR